MMPWRHRSPVVIGGIGGSGTRVVAEAVSKMGYFLGSDLNSMLDNLWFTLLFKRPSCGQEMARTDARSLIAARLTYFSNRMQGQGSRWAGFSILAKAVLEMSTKGHNYQGAGRGLWAFSRMAALLRAARPDPNEYVGWGWKEPNTHIYLDHLDKHFEHLKYVHLIRHGLDMAFSANVQQLHLWSQQFGVPTPRSPEDVPVQTLTYWIKANQRACDIGQRMGEDRFLLMRFEDLCLNPERELTRLVQFLELGSSPDIAKLITLVKTPHSLGRYRDRDTSIFPEHMLDSLRAWGFDLPKQV